VEGEGHGEAPIDGVELGCCCGSGQVTPPLP
jgi:hypothetical protein